MTNADQIEQAVPVRIQMDVMVTQMQLQIRWHPDREEEVDEARRAS